MGGSKNKSPAQKEKSQKSETDKKGGTKKKDKDKSKREPKSEISVIVDEPQAMKFIKSSKVVTVQELSRQTGVKISAANAFLLNLYSAFSRSMVEPQLLKLMTYVTRSKSAIQDRRSRVRFGSKADTQKRRKCRKAEFGA